jgi:hypothetical protein
MLVYFTSYIVENSKDMLKDIIIHKLVSVLKDVIQILSERHLVVGGFRFYQSYVGNGCFLSA